MSVGKDLVPTRPHVWVWLRDVRWDAAPHEQRCQAAGCVARWSAVVVWLADGGRRLEARSVCAQHGEALRRLGGCLVIAPWQFDFERLRAAVSQELHRRQQEQWTRVTAQQGMSYGWGVQNINVTGSGNVFIRFTTG